MTELRSEQDKFRIDRDNAHAHFERIKEKIMDSWESRVRGNVSSATEKTQRVLRNMLPELLNNLGANLSSASINSDFKRAGNIGKEHGEQRGGLSDYTISQVLYEYRVLREVIFEILEQEKLHSPAIRNIILRVLDEGIQKAIAQFTIVRSRELEQSNRDLEHFASIAAHDLKSPLATISGFMELLGEDLRNKIDFTDAENIKIVKRSAASMTLLIDRLLEYSGIGRKIDLFTQVSTNEIIKQVVENLKDLIDSSQAKIVFRDLPRVRGDASLLSQLFQNLISNAIKFRDDRRLPEVRIEAKEEPNDWVFSVSDNGLGIKQEDKEILFTLFKKVHSKQAHKGYGIGLATVRKVVELHGGRVWVESNPRMGSIFFFTLAK